MAKKEQGILDTINTNPVFNSIIPSTKKKFKYRGYTAGEEQTLLVAKESGDIETILDNVKQLISKCTFSEVDPEKLAGFDIEYILLIMRAKSVGEEIELTMKCNKCDKENDTVLNIQDIERPVIIKGGNVVVLNDNVSVIMKYPGFGVLEEMTKPGVDVFAIVAGLITQVVKGDDIIETSELNPDEVTTFVRGMLSSVIKKMTKFIADAPSVKHEVKIKCIHCTHDNVYNFKGLNNFFA